MAEVERLIAELKDRVRSVAHLHGIKLIAGVWLVFMLSWIFGTPENEEF